MRRGIATGLLAVMLTGTVTLAMARPANASSPWVERFLIPVIVGVVLAEYAAHREAVETFSVAEARKAAGWLGRWLSDQQLLTAHDRMCGLVNQGYALALVHGNSLTISDEEALGMARQLEEHCGPKSLIEDYGGSA